MKQLSGRVMPENKIRNRALIQKREEGYSYNRLAQLFEVSPQRCFQIYKKYLKRKEQEI